MQIQVDQDPLPTFDNWGAWNKLAPFQNVYDHQVAAFSWFGPSYCEFTPTDTGDAMPAPRGVHETLCYPLGAWSHCGSVRGADPDAVGDCAGPGEVDPGGSGVWVESRFDLTLYRGQRVRIRWISSSWAFDSTSSSYFELGDGWADAPGDDGWWIDDIRINGTVAMPVVLVPDPASAAGSPGALDFTQCDPSLGADHGTSPLLAIPEAVPYSVAGKPLRVSAYGSTLPGGCPDGVPEYQFFRNGALVQDWSGSATAAPPPRDPARSRRIAPARASQGPLSVSRVSATPNACQAIDARARAGS